MEGYAQHRGVEDVWGVLEGRQESRRYTKADSNGRTLEPTSMRGENSTSPLPSANGQARSGSKSIELGLARFPNVRSPLGAEDRPPIQEGSQPGPRLWIAKLQAKRPQGPVGFEDQACKQPKTEYGRLAGFY